MLRIPKQRIDIYLAPDDYVWLVKYSQYRKCRNLSYGVRKLISDFKNTKKALNDLHNKIEEPKEQQENSEHE